MKKESNERLLILDLNADAFPIFDILDLEEFKNLLIMGYAYDDRMSDGTLMWYGEDAVYYYQINDDGNVVLKDLIARWNTRS